MLIFAIILLISSVIAFFVQVTRNTFDVGLFLYTIFFTLYIMGIGR